MNVVHLLSALALLFTPSALSQNITIPIVAPGDAKALPSNLLGFSIEQDRWPDWAGTDSRNQFTHEALLNYAHLTGTPPHIRVGANTEDHTIWSPTVTVSSCAVPSSISASMRMLLFFQYLGDLTVLHKLKQPRSRSYSIILYQIR